MNTVEPPPSAPPRSRAKVPSHSRCEAIRCSSAKIVRIHRARRGTSSLSAASKAMFSACSLVIGAT